MPVEVVSRGVQREDQMERGRQDQFERGRQDQFERMLTQQSAQLNQLTQVMMLQPATAPVTVEVPIYETVAVARHGRLEGKNILASWRLKQPCA